MLQHQQGINFLMVNDHSLFIWSLAPRMKWVFHISKNPFFFIKQHIMLLAHTRFREGSCIMLATRETN
jgi:hypothetical protein